MRCFYLLGLNMALAWCPQQNDSSSYTGSADNHCQQQIQLKNMSAIEDLETSLSHARDAYRRRVFQLDHRVFELETLLDLRTEEVSQQRDVNWRVRAQLNRYARATPAEGFVIYTLRCWYMLVMCLLRS
jgi:hypothetical protein